MQKEVATEWAVLIRNSGTDGKGGSDGIDDTDRSGGMHVQGFLSAAKERYKKEQY